LDQLVTVNERFRHVSLSYLAGSALIRASVTTIRSAWPPAATGAESQLADDERSTPVVGVRAHV
jgi:hypothetical protein